MTPDRVDELAQIATELALRVRDDSAESNGRWLAAALPDPADWWALCFVLAAAVPDDRSWRHLTAWTAIGPEAAPLVRQLRPHGTPAAAERHRYHGEDLCDTCRESERKRDRERKKAAYWAGKDGVA